MGGRGRCQSQNYTPGWPNKKIPHIIQSLHRNDDGDDADDDGYDDDDDDDDHHDSH